MRSLLSILVFFSFVNLSGQPLPELSPASRISLLTCGTGQENLYSFFGHSALWVYDPEQAIDKIYNYGTFDFDTPNFYMKFVTGTPQYKLSVTSFRYFLSEYIAENRSVRQQILGLTLQEKQLLYLLLEENYQPENRYYRYDFLFDNCSSRIRDIVLKAVGDRYHLENNTSESLSFRELLDPYIVPTPLIKEGINLLLASGADRKAELWEYMFLPNYLESLFREYSDNSAQSLVESELTLFASETSEEPDSIFNQPVFWIGLILVISILLTLFQKRYSIMLKSIDTLLFFITGLMGILFVFMWFFSEYTVTNANINLVWGFPLHILLGIFIWIAPLKNWTKWYARCMLILMLAGALIVPLIPQKISGAGIMLFFLVGVRLVHLAAVSKIIKQEPKKETNQ